MCYQTTMRDESEAVDVADVDRSPPADRHPGRGSTTDGLRELAMEHLDTALTEEAPVEKNYYIRSALQALVMVEEAERPSR